MLESAVIRRIFSLWKCTESAPLSEAKSLGKKLLINQQCRGGETGRRARLKIWFPQGSVGSSPTLGTIKSIITVFFAGKFKMYTNQS